MQQAGGTPMMRPVPWFLATAPSPAPEMVPRTAFTESLERAVARHHATVVSAPSGFGKTVAVSQWAARHRRAGPGTVTWLTLTDHVADFGDVLRGILTALQQSARQRGDAPLHHSISTVFDAGSHVDALAAITAMPVATPIVVVIDDFQNAREIVAGPAFTQLLEHGPSWLRLILVTTDAVPPALARLHTHGRLTVLGHTHLTLSAAEIANAAALLGSAMDRGRAEQIAATTGGWAAAVRLTLVSDAGAPTVDADLTDYIRTAVLARMRPDLADFVLRATACTRVDGELACALSERPDGAQALDECTSAGLFLERFSSTEGTVYQWHSMFASRCQAILRHDDPQRWRMLHARAARKLAPSYPLAAVDHAISAGQAGLTTEVIAEHWLELLLQSQSNALDRACVAATRAFGESPELLLIRACCRDLAGDTAAATLLFDRGRTAARDETPSPRTVFIADLTEVLLSADQDQMAAAADRAQSALADRSIVDPITYACALFLLGWANSRLRRGERGHALMEAAAHECRALGLTELAERARQNLGFALAAAGEFDRAMRHLSVADRDPAGTPELWLTHDGGGVERFAEGYVRFWRGELDAAREVFVGLDAAAGSGFPDVGRMMLAMTVTALGERDGVDVAQAAVRRIPDTDSHGVPWTSYKLASRARLAELRGARGEALDLAGQLVDRTHVPMMSVIAAGIGFRLGEPALARQLADAAKDDESQPYSQAYALLVHALLDWGAGDAAAAHRNLEHCLALAAAERVVLPFIDLAGPACAELLAAHAPYTGYPEFLERCLLACERRIATRTPQDGLTPREQQVLTQLRKQMTANEIAAQLGVSVNTVKTHQRAIYRKLGVANRREAIRVARTDAPDKK